MFTFTGALAAMSIDLLDCSGHAAAGTRHQCDAHGRTAAGTRHQCDAHGRADGAYQHQCDAPGRAAAARSIDWSKRSHVFNTHGIMYYSFGAIAASPKDWFECSQSFHVYVGVMCTFTGALAAMSFDLL